MAPFGKGVILRRPHFRLTPFASSPAEASTRAGAEHSVLPSPRDSYERVGRGRRPRLRIDLLLLCLLIAAVTAVYAVYALRVGNFQNDEEQYMQLARYIARHFPDALWQSGIYPRGTQRLDPTILAIPFALMRGPGAFQVAHVIQALLFASTAIPVFLIARRAKLGAAASLLAAAVSVVVPWAVVSTSFLAESAAYPAYAWVLFTTWLTATSPSTRNDALALVALVVAALSRTAMLGLAPLLPLAVLWNEWTWALRGRPLSRRMRELPVKVWRDHRLLTLAMGLAALALIADRAGLLPGQGVGALAGGYGIPHVEALSSLLVRYRDYLSRMVAGTGLLAAAVALPWVLGNILRPRDGHRQALAALCALGVGAILLSLLQAGPDERYVLYGAAPIALACSAALADWAHAPQRGPAAVVGVLLGAVVVVLLLDSSVWPELANTYDFFSYPAAQFFHRVVLLHAGLLHVPLLHPSGRALVYAGLIAVVALFATAGRSSRAARPAAALMAMGLVVLCATQALYALRKFTNTAGAASGPNAAARSWVDRHVPSGAQVGALGISMGETLAYLPLWRATEFWNTSVTLDSFVGKPGLLPFPLYSEARPLKIQSPSGLLSAADRHGVYSATVVPRYMLVPLQGTNALGLAAEPVAQSTYMPLELVRLKQPPRVDWTTSGDSTEGFVTSGQAATATVYGGALAGEERRCARFSLLGPPGFSGRWPFAVREDRRIVRRGSIAALQTVPVSVRLPSGPGLDREARLTVTVKGQVAFVNGLTVSAKLAFFEVGACRL